MIIADARARMQRAQQKRQALLRFLREECYTTPHVAALVMGCGERAARQTVQAMERAGLVRRHVVQLAHAAPPLVLVGITDHGQAMAFDPDAGERVLDRTFEPGRYALATLAHTIDMQRLRVLAERGGAVRRWLPGDMLGAGRAHEKRPDAVLLTRRGVRVALEVERTLKSRKRYAAVLAGHIEAMRQGRWTYALWVSPSDAVSKRVRALVLSSSRVRVSGIDTPLTDSHRAHLRFCVYDAFLSSLKEIDDAAQA